MKHTGRIATSQGQSPTSTFQDRNIDTVIIGAGAAGLAMSYELAKRSIDHVVLERGDIANSWRNERWDSLKLLSPNWQTRLPGKCYDGNDPDGFMGMPELIQFMEDYARANSAPVHTGVTVTAVSATTTSTTTGYRVDTNRGRWNCRALVIATGAFNRPALPKVSECVSSVFSKEFSVNKQSITSHEYKNPEQLASSGVLVVGASATGLQLASEIRASGRDVTIAVGEHVRLPRHYRGKDIFWWMDRAGVAGESFAQVDDVSRVRSLPSPQLIGSKDYSIFDLNTLQAQGVKVVGRLMHADENGWQFSGSLHNVCQLADLKMGRLLKRFDEWIMESEQREAFPEAECFSATRLPEKPQLQLRASDINTVVWATGYKPDYSWLHLPVLDRKGMLVHSGGVVKAPGVYALGLPFLRRRNSSFIRGIAEDAVELSQHLQDFLKEKSVSSAFAVG